ncbi:hypothetical protein [Microbacterium sp. XT11]|uniref:hypothetical protein n=1 Tax=Microbacterium sp. XT11 TaxID=367477 RepID=UPI000830C16D|nr:hypothetical protein [Microbacterium sp. XT11]
MADRFQGESDPIATNPILRGVDLAVDRLVRADCFTERTLRVLDELRAEVLAAEQAHTQTDDERVSLMDAATDAFAKHEGAPTWQDDPVGRDAALRWHMRGFEDGLNARRAVHTPTDDEREVLRRVREFATKERDSIRGRYGADSATYAGYANACDDILSILDGDPSAHGRDRDGICRRCGHALTAAEVLDGETPCEPQGEPSDAAVIAGAEAMCEQGPANTPIWDDWVWERFSRAALRAAAEVRGERWA